MEAISLFSMMVLFCLSLLLHILVITRVLPYSFLWGGRLQSNREMYRFEIVSILVNLIFLLFVLAFGGYLGFDFAVLIYKIGFWGMAILFAANTLGNLFSKSKLERVVFTPVTIALSFFAVTIALSL
jgi:hypothetical protein